MATDYAALAAQAGGTPTGTTPHVTSTIRYHQGHRVETPGYTQDYAAIATGLGGAPQSVSEPPAKQEEPYGPTWAERLNIPTHARPYMDIFEGAAAGIMSTAVHGGDILRRFVGADRIIDRPDVQRLITPPPTVGGKIGFYGEQAAEFMAPAAKIADATRGMHLLGRIGAEAATGGAIAGVQTGLDPVATAAGVALGAAVPPAGAALGATGRAISRAAAGAKEGGVGGAVAGAIRRVGNTRPARMLEQAMKPRSTKFNWEQRADFVLPELKAAERKIGRPIQNISDLYEAINVTKRDIWRQIEDHMRQGRGMKMEVDGNKVADAIEGSITATMKREAPRQVEKLKALAQTYRGGLDISEADQLLKEANALLEAFYAKFLPSQRKAAAADPTARRLLAKSAALREAIYEAIDRVGDSGAIKELKKRYGALLDVEDPVYRRWVVAHRQQPESLAEQIAGAEAIGEAVEGTMLLGHSVMSGQPLAGLWGIARIAGARAKREAARYIKEMQTMDRLIERAFASEGRSMSAVPPPQPFKPRGLLEAGAHRAPPVADPSSVRTVPADFEIQGIGDELKTVFKGTEKQNRLTSPHPRSTLVEQGPAAPPPFNKSSARLAITRREALEPVKRPDGSLAPNPAQRNLSQSERQVGFLEGLHAEGQKSKQWLRENGIYSGGSAGAMRFADPEVALHIVKDTAGDVADGLIKYRDWQNYLVKKYGPEVKKYAAALWKKTWKYIDGQKQFVQLGKDTSEAATERFVRNNLPPGVDSSEYVSDVLKFLRKMTRSGAAGRGALRGNSKTLLSVDITGDCPWRAAGSPCTYCYVEQPRSYDAIGGQTGGKVAKVFDQAPYRGDILDMPDMLVKFFNEQMGGLRVFSMGDYRQKDLEILNRVVADARKRGLQLKVITKQPEMIERFANQKHMRFNVSTDFSKDWGAAIARGNRKLEYVLTDPDNKGVHELVSYGMPMDQAKAFRTANKNVAVRYVAVNRADAIHAVVDPQIDVVTLYHGFTDPKKLQAIWRKQNPALYRNLGPETVNELSTVFEAPHEPGRFPLITQGELDKVLGKGKVSVDDFEKMAARKLCCQTGKCGTCTTCCGFGRNYGNKVISQQLSGATKNSVDLVVKQPKAQPQMAPPKPATYTLDSLQ